MEKDGAKHKAPKIIKDLIERYNRNQSEYKGKGYNEFQLRNEFINPIFAALGWDIENKKWIDVTHILVYMDGSVDTIRETLDDGYTTKDYYEDEYILMQYTGLKDKNGNEIYEGDILKYTDPDENNQPVKSRRVVKWDEWKMLDELQNGFSIVEVVGNIYENPELVKK